MKKNLKFIVAVIVLSVAAFAKGYAQNTKTFYVCSNTGFTLVPQINTFTDYEWVDVDNAVTPVGTSQNLSLTSPTLPGTTYATKKYALKVKNGVGCWSEPDTFTVFVLPAINVSVSGAASAYCANLSIPVTLSANVNQLTLPAGVTADKYEWKLAGNTVGTGVQLAVNSGIVAGTKTYNVTVSYNLPNTIGGSKLSACDAAGSGDVVVTNAPTTPSISIQ